MITGFLNILTDVYIASMFRLLALVLLVSCGRSEPETYNSQVSTVPATPCPPPLDILSGNSYTDQDRQLVVALHQLSDAWVLDVYDKPDCTLQNRAELPTPETPDYPYFLADLLYNSALGNVGIRGPKNFFIYHLADQKLSPPIFPTYLNERLPDESSGQIEHLEVWEDYLVGCTADWGAFVFRMDSIAVLPVAEIEKEERYLSLFLIEIGQTNRYQAIIPVYDYEQGGLDVNPLFEEPLPLDTSKTIFAAGSSYARLQQVDGELLTIDLARAELVKAIKEVQISN